MQQLTPQGQQVVNDFANKYGFSADAVTHMLFAVLNGNGTMAQFSHPEFGGSGQWMRGGMIMLGDMFNNDLKGRVDALCTEICQVLAQPARPAAGPAASSPRARAGAATRPRPQAATHGPVEPLRPRPGDHWWPPDLGTPSATGAQNNVRYAYFANGRRLAVRPGGEVWVYDTLDHQIGGFSQQQGGAARSPSPASTAPSIWPACRWSPATANPCSSQSPRPRLSCSDGRKVGRGT